MRIQVKDFMSSPVTTATLETTIAEVRKLMNDQRINAVPIISYSKSLPESETTIRGIVTASDISKDLDANATLKDLITNSSIHVLHVDSSAQAAARMMLRHKVHHMVVMEDGKIKGMISSLDFVKLVAEHSLD